jgi:hypothetical protein
MVFIEKASLDAIKSEDLFSNSLPSTRTLTNGKHLFEKT